MGEHVDWRGGLQDLADQVLNLTPVQWGYVAIVAAALVLWAWVMGAPKPRGPGAAVVLVGAGLCLAIALFAPHHHLA